MGALAASFCVFLKRRCSLIRRTFTTPPRAMDYMASPPDCRYCFDPFAFLVTAR